MWTVITDFDGIFTTSCFTYTLEGKTAKSFSPNDAHVAKMLIPHLAEFQILTGETSDTGIAITERRLADVGLIDRLNVCPSVHKLEWIKQRYDMSKVAYFGDDIHDMKIFRECGFSACPASALPILKNFATYVSPQRGGEDALADMLLQFAAIHLEPGILDI